MTAKKLFAKDVAARHRGEPPPFITWWKANAEKFPTYQFASAEFSRLESERAATFDTDKLARDMAADPVTRGDA